MSEISDAELEALAATICLEAEARARQQIEQEEYDVVLRDYTIADGIERLLAEKQALANERDELIAQIALEAQEAWGSATESERAMAGGLAHLVIANAKLIEENRVLESLVNEYASMAGLTKGEIRSKIKALAADALRDDKESVKR